ncbi:MAG: BON domain-containing protein, partial [Armatimonadetes bacterium]|nr:BON domain-containing protein [Armatimonadota bacterium]
MLGIRVKKAIQNAAELRECDLRVHVGDGVVTLEGFAPDERLKALAGELAESIHGVEEVEN